MTVKGSSRVWDTTGTHTIWQCKTPAAAFPFPNPYLGFGLPITLLYFRVSVMFPKINGNGKRLTYLSLLCSTLNLHMLDFPIPPTPKNKKQQGHHRKPRNHLIWQEPLKRTTVPFPFKGISFSLHKGASHLHEAADRRTMPRARMARPKVSAL